MLPYLGPGWGRKALALMRGDPRIAAALRGVELSLLIRIRDAPEGRYQWIFARFDGAGLAEGLLGHDRDGRLEGLGPPTFAIEGPYAAFAAIQRGELSERKALLSGRLHVKGPRFLALRHLGTLETLTGVLGEIPCQT